MVTDICKAANSNYIEAARRFRSASEKPRIYVYVEDDIDKIFWRIFFKSYENHYLINIETLKIENKAMRGKSSLLTHIDLSTLGRNKLICIDSDLDLIVPNYSNDSSQILSNRYIITTFLYSIENFKCHHSNLSEYIYKSTLSDCLEVDFKSIMDSYSNLIADLFLILLVSLNLDDKVYTMKMFKADISIIKYTRTNFLLENTEKIKMKISQRATYKNEKISDIRAFEEFLRNGGFNRDCYYLLINGHDLKDCFIIPMLKDLVCTLRSKKISDIYNLSGEGEDRKKCLEAQYKQQTHIGNNNKLQDRLETLIDDCTSYEDCFASQFIRSKISSIIN